MGRAVRAVISGMLLFAMVGCGVQPEPGDLSGVSPLLSPAATLTTFNSPSAPACTQWDTVKPELGQTVCVEGDVAEAYNIGNDFFIEFSAARDSIYGKAHNYFYPGIEGKCAKLSGEVKVDETGRYFVQVDLPGQVEPCLP